MDSRSEQIYKEMKPYEPIVRGIARNACHNCIVDEDDYYQELMMKLFMTWDYIKDLMYEDPTGVIKKIMKRRTISIINYYKDRPDTSWNSKESNFNTNEEGDGDFSILDDVYYDHVLSNGSSFPEPENYLEIKELIEVLNGVKKESNKDIGDFLDSVIDDECVEVLEYINDEFLSNSKRKVDKAYITPFQRAKLLGYSSSFPYKVMASVKKALTKNGYEIPDAILGTAS